MKLKYERMSEAELEELYFIYQQMCQDCRKLNGGKKYGEHMCKKHNKEMRERWRLV